VAVKPRSDRANSVASTVRTRILPLLAEGEPSISDVASSVGLSARTLQRRLEQEGTSFSGVLDALRREEAMRALAASDRSLADLAVALGYRRQSTLTRAVRRWTGMPPSRLRAQIRA
jgi:AraC-like DNA-binding protein